MPLHLKRPLACLDLETTGVSVVHDRIVEIAIVKLMPDGNIVSFDQRLNPEIPIPLEASLVHNIFDADVSDKPTFRQIAKKLYAFLQGTDLAGFNLIRFDLPLLVDSFLRENLDFDLNNRAIVDVQKIFHLMEKRTLKAAYAFYCNKELKDAHSALADSMATLEVLIEQVHRYENCPVSDALGKTIGVIQNDLQALHRLSTPHFIDLAARFVFNEDHVPIFNFGKYKGKPVLDILKSDPAYYNWMLNGDFTLDTKRKLTMLKLGLLKC